MIRPSELLACHLGDEFETDACDRPADMTWSEHFLPVYEGQHLHAYCEPLHE